MEEGYRQFDKACVGTCRWLKLIVVGRRQHQQRQHGHLAFGGVVAGQGRDATSACQVHRIPVLLGLLVHVGTAHLHVPHWHSRHRRHGAKTEQKAVVGTGEGRKHDQPNYDHCSNQAAREIAYRLPYRYASGMAMHRNSTELPYALDRLSSTNRSK